MTALDDNLGDEKLAEVTKSSTSKPKRIITGHDHVGNGIIQVVDEGYWRSIAGDTSRYNVFWKTQSCPVDVARDENLEKEVEVSSLSLPNGTVLRIVDRAPHAIGPMHRTQSLDYGVLMEGEAELLMDSGDRITMQPGDICIMRQTMHQWRNNGNKWNRMLFVLIDAIPLEVAGNIYKGETGLDHIKEIKARK